MVREREEEKKRGNQTALKPKARANGSSKAISIYSSCNWVRFFNPNDKDSNWLSSRSLVRERGEYLSDH
jgi:hypothetical protein